MIVQCDQCNTKFRLDDAKVKEGDVKVRCSKCKNIFVVHAEAPAEEADFDSFLSGLMPPPAEAPGDLGAIAPATEPSGSQLIAAPGMHLEVESLIEEDAPPRGGFPGQADFDLSEFTFNDQTPGPKPAPASPGGGQGTFENDLVFGELDLGKGEPSGITPANREEGAEATSSEDFVSKAEPTPPVPEFELNLDGFNVFAETGEAVTSGAPPSPITEEDFFADASKEFSFERDTAELKSVHFTSEEETVPELPAPFDFSEAPVSIKGETVQEKPETWIMGEQESSEYSRISAPPPPEIQAFDEEFPPLSISSRRKGISLLPIAVTVVSILLVFALAIGGFYLFKEGPAAFNKLGLGFMAKWFGMETREEGGIAVRKTAGIFLNNKEVGEIFAINGEAVNNFGKPRASIQVKATLFGPNGAVLMQKNAYCGNVLSREQLSTLPIAKLEAAMNNQFGDSLSNLTVQPGKAIPFVVVLQNVPKEVVEFGVEVVNSTVASQ